MGMVIMDKAVLNVQGMSCGHCVKTITNALGELPGVNNINIDLNKATVAFSFETAQTPLEKIKLTITEAGYDIV